MKYWLTTDTHFNHGAIKEYCGRPDDYEERILKGLCSIPHNDVLIHLGDVCLGKDEEMHKHFIKPFSYKKILVRGNHDKKSDNWYLAHGWDWVCKTMEIERMGKRILFSHRPMVWNGYWTINIHGHFHNTNHRRDEPGMNRDLLAGQHLLALEYNNYKPWILDSILEKAND